MPPIARRSARDSARLRWSALGLVVVLLLVAACIGGELGTSSVETDFQTTLTLTADRPMVTRSLDYVAKAGAQRVSAIDGHIEVLGVGGARHPDVWISILNLETGESADRPEGIGSATVDGGSHAAPCDGKPLLEDGDYRDLPTPPCQARWTVIARWLEPQAGVEIPLELNAHMRANATQLYPESDPFTLEALAITDAGVPLPADGPAVTRDAVRGSTKLTPSSRSETHNVLLRVPAVLLDKAGGDVRLGRIFVGIDLKERSPSISMRTELSIDDEVVASATAPISMERDWLGRCRPGSDCQLPIKLTFEPVAASQVATMSPDGVVAFDWVVEARFEDFGERATVPAEIELVEP